MTDSDLTRRRALALGGAAASAVLGLGTSACSSRHRHAPDAHKAPDAELCVLNPSVTQGPYHLADAPFRKDITEGKEGVPLTVRLTVRDQPHACALLKDAAVEIWQCDAWGYHSGFPHVPPGGSAPAESHVSGIAPMTYLRGFQTTGADGVAEFTTIFPGWYTGRAPHLHVRVHTGGKKTAGTYKGGRVNWTGQLFLPDSDADAVYAKAPYTRHTGTRTRLAHDPVYRGGGARDGLMTVTGDAGTGLVATLTVGIDSTREDPGAGGSPASPLPGSASADGSPPPDSAASASRTPTSDLTPRSPDPSAPAVPRTP